MKLLPIGTIIKLKGGSKKLMIYGRNIRHIESNENYDYLACLYPEGYIGDTYNVFFNACNISEICSNKDNKLD